MSVFPAGRAPRALLAGLGIALGITPAVSMAQTRTEGRNFNIAFEPGNASRNGYMDAQVQVTYYFGVCAGQVAFLARYNAIPQMLVGNHRYWVDGRQVSVPPQISAPRLESPTVRGTIRGPNTVREITYLYASSAPTPSCLTNDLGLGQTSNYWPAGTPQDRQLAILNQFGLDYRGTLPPLRSSEVEAHFRQIFAQERTDSLNKARATEQQRLVAQRDSAARTTRARQDSLARAAEQRRAAQSAGGQPAGTQSAGAVGGASGSASASTAGSTGSSTGGGGAEAPRTVSQAERDAALRAEREAAADAAARDARIRQQQAAEQERLRVEQDQQLVAALEAGTIAVLGIFESIAESRRINAEKKRQRDLIAQREASARYAAYVAATKARFDAAPPQPNCTNADIRDSIVVSQRTSQRSLRLSGSECRLYQGHSAILLTLIVDADAPVQVATTANGVISTLQILDAETNKAVTARFESEFSTATLPRGRYTLVVSSRLPGEVGEVTLTTRKLWLSDVQGSVGGAMGPAKQIDGFVGRNQQSTSFMDLSVGLQHRAGLPYLYTAMLVPTDSEAQEYMIDVGLRHYIGRTTRRISPWVEASLGYRNIFVRGEPFTTVSPAFGAGVNFRFNAEYALALSATQVTGKARTADESIWSSPPPPVPLNRTLFRLGIMIF
jgi:hypothetical protein